MDDPSLQVTASSLEIESGEPSSGGSGGHDGGGLRNGSSAIIGSAAEGLTETTPATLSSPAPSLQGHGHLVANEPTTTPDSLRETSLLTGQSGQPNSERRNVAVVGLQALNRTDDVDFQQGLAVLVEAETAQDEQPNPGGGENVAVVGAHAVAQDSTIDFQQEEPAAALQVEEAGPNAGGSRNIVVELYALSSSSADDFQQETVVPEPVGIPGQAERNAEGGENIAVGLNAANSPNDAQQEVELALPVEVPDDDHKRPHEDAAKQLEIRSSQGRKSNEGVDESLVCPICMEPWTNSGEHRICALACGHLFGKSCIERWLLQAGRKVSRCPHCNKRARVADVRTLYVPGTLAVVDGDTQQLAQEVRTLRAENLRLKSEKKKLLQKVLQNKERNGLVQSPALPSLAENSATIHLINVAEPPNISTGSEPVQNLGDEVASSSHSFGISYRQAFDSRSRSGISFGRQDRPHTEVGSYVYGRVSEAGSYPGSSRAEGMDNCGGSFQLQNVVPVHGGNVFDMDAESLTVIFSNKNQGCGSGSGLSKMSLLSSREIEKIEFPSGFGAIRDIRLSPSGIGGTGKCAVVASAGKNLSLISLDSNNIVLTYSVQSPPWSCAWDPCVPNLLYSGLQNGCLLLVDLRHTSSPIAMLNGPSNRPIHTLQVVRSQSSLQANMGSQPSGGKEILSASNSGISLWNVGSSVAGSEMATPQGVFSDKELVCISLVYECAANTAVASFRRSPSAQTELSSSSSHGASAEQISSQPIDGHLNSRASPSAIGRKEPSHWVFSRCQGSSRSEMNEMIKTAESRPPWERMGAMAGNKCKSLMTRSAIISQSISTPRSKSLFACGDDGTNSVWLWDMKSCRLAGTLVPHQSPILDVKNVQIQGKDMLGCVSEGTFQFYRRAMEYV